MSTQAVPTNHGWKFILAGALFPVTVGLLAWLTSYLYCCVINPDTQFRFIHIVFGFRFSETTAISPEMAALFRANQHVCWSNVHSGGVQLALLGYFGVRQGHRWAWVACLYGFSFGGINDSIAAIDLYLATAKGVPMPVIATSLGMTGLWISRPWHH